MSDSRPPSPRHLPSGIIAAAVIGVAAGAVSWVIAGAWVTMIHGYIRLDQLTMLTLGAVTGAATVAGDAWRRREAPRMPAVHGVLLGGIGALVPATVFAVLSRHGSGGFAFERILGWGLTAAATAAAISLARPPLRGTRIGAAALVAGAGGIVSGVLLLLPGITELWQALAFVWFGAVVGVAVVAPWLVGAIAVVEIIPGRNALPTMLTLREWPIDDGDSVTLNAAQLACINGRLVLYPPSTGVSLNGHLVISPRVVEGTALVTVGRARYEILVRTRR